MKRGGLALSLDVTCDCFVSRFQPIVGVKLSLRNTRTTNSICPSGKNSTPEEKFSSNDQFFLLNTAIRFCWERRLW